MSTQPVRRVAAEILRYCSTRPMARDSIEGITWWVAHQCFDDAKNHVPHAVELLIQRGELTRHTLPDGSQVFGVSQTD